MTFGFQQIPANTLIPFVGVEFDASQSSQGPALLAYRNLLIGQKTSSGAAAADTLHLVTSPDQVAGLAGRDSMLYQMAVAWFRANRVQELWIGVLEDDSGGVAAAGKITFSGTCTKAGPLPVYFGDKRFVVGCDVGDTAADVAAAVHAAANAVASENVFTTSASSAELTVTFKHKGAAGNEFPLDVAYQVGEQLPEGLTATITPMADGAGNPSLDGLIAAMGDQWFNVVAHPYTDATSLGALEAEFASRAHATRMIDGICITSRAADVGDLVSLGTGRNSAYSVIIAPPGTGGVTPTYAFAAVAAATVALHAAQDPARPFQTLELPGVLPPKSLFKDFEERNVLLHNGIATTRAVAGAVQLEGVITTYQKNAAGADDTAYRSVNTVLTLSYLRYSWRAWMLQRYPRHKLGNDGGRYAAGQPIMTPLLGKAEAIAWFMAMEQLGLVEDLSTFKAHVRTARNATNRDRLDVLLPPDLMNQLIVTATSMQFRI